MDLRKQHEEYKNKCLQIVQKYIEIDDDNHNPEEFLQDCQILTRPYFDDLIEERSSIDLCGYALCNKKLSQTVKKLFKDNQKYHIKNNQVFEITRRKNFCSDLCFKRAEFLGKQISTEPLYLRTKTSVKLELYQDKSGQSGDIVPLKDPLDDAIEETKKNGCNTKPQNVSLKKILRDEKAIETKLSAPYLKVEEFEDLKNKFQDFKIKEKNQNINEINETETSKLISGGESIEESILSEEQIENDQIDQFYHIPTRELLLDEIDRFSISTSSSMTDLSITSFERKKLKKQKFLQKLIRKMSNWITDDTRSLLGIEQTTKSCDENLPTNFSLEEEDETKKLERFRWEYIRLCAKLDQEELEDEKYDQMVLNSDKQEKNQKKTKKSNKKPKKEKSVIKTDNDNDQETMIDEAEILQNKLSMFFNGEPLQIENEAEETNKKKVRFSDDTQSKGNGEEEPEQDEQLFLPLNENQHAVIRRKQIFLGEIQQFLNEILQDDIDTLEIDEILSQIRCLVDTFCLKPENTPVGPKNNYLTSILLLRIVLLYHLIDFKHDRLFETNIFIKTIMDKFQLKIDYIDNEIIRQKIFL